LFEGKKNFVIDCELLANIWYQLMQIIYLLSSSWLQCFSEGYLWQRFQMCFTAKLRPVV